MVGGKKVKTTKPPWEKDYLLADAGDVFGEYLEMVIQVLYHSSLNNYYSHFNRCGLFTVRCSDYNLSDP